MIKSLKFVFDNSTVHICKMLFLSLLLFDLTVAQRPTNASICDYYAEINYGVNNSANQYRLIQSIVSLAYVGGDVLPSARNITGILFPGTFMDLKVDLGPWFDGSSTTIIK